MYFSGLVSTDYRHLFFSKKKAKQVMEMYKQQMETVTENKPRKRSHFILIITSSD